MRRRPTQPPTDHLPDSTEETSMPRMCLSVPVLLSVCAAALALCAATAHAAEYKMVNCAAISGAPPYTLESNTGIFSFENDCVDQGGDPPGDKSFLRISEHEPGGNAAYGAYENVNIETPSGINFRSAGGYTRDPTPSTRAGRRASASTT